MFYIDNILHVLECNGPRTFPYGTPHYNYVITHVNVYFNTFVIEKIGCSQLCYMFLIFTYLNTFVYCALCAVSTTG